jgi:hypothetical protein
VSWVAYMIIFCLYFIYCEMPVLEVLDPRGTSEALYHNVTSSLEYAGTRG